MNFSPTFLTMMTSPVTVTSPTFPLTDEQREWLTDALIQRWLDHMSTRDLERFFTETQAGYLEDYSDEEL
jgi:hypothetical protein